MIADLKSLLLHFVQRDSSVDNHFHERRMTRLIHHSSLPFGELSRVRKQIGLHVTIGSSRPRRLKILGVHHHYHQRHVLINDRQLHLTSNCWPVKCVSSSCGLRWRGRCAWNGGIIEIKEWLRTDCCEPGSDAMLMVLSPAPSWSRSRGWKKV